MHRLIRDLTARVPVVTDGAWATQLQARGLQLGECAEAWNITHPDQVVQVGSAYVAAGSRVILSNTFGGNRLALAKHGLADRMADINRNGVQLSLAAANGKACVFASVGPSGKMLMMNEVDATELEEVFTGQVTVLAEAGAEGIVVETMIDLEEAVIAASAALRTGLPVVACLVFDSGPQRDRTIMGVGPEEAAKALAGAGVDVIGANCGQGIEGFVPLASRLVKATSKPVWIKANAGLPQVEGGQVAYHTTPAQFAASVPALRDAGVGFIGGCCGTTPAYISEVCRVLERSS